MYVCVFIFGCDKGQGSFVLVLSGSRIFPYLNKPINASQLLIIFFFFHLKEVDQYQSSEREFTRPQIITRQKKTEANCRDEKLG